MTQGIFRGRGHVVYKTMIKREKTERVLLSHLLVFTAMLTLIRSYFSHQQAKSSGESEIYKDKSATRQYEHSYIVFAVISLWLKPDFHSAKLLLRVRQDGLLLCVFSTRTNFAEHKRNCGVEIRTVLLVYDEILRENKCT